MLIPLQTCINSDLEACTLGILPLVHTQTMDIIEKEYKEVLKPLEKCDIFEEYLTYLYYGVPLYRHKDMTIDNLPVCLLLEAKKIQAYKMYPMDTGAFHGQPMGRGDEMEGFFEALGQPAKQSIALFELSYDYDNVRRYILTFFGSNMKYCASECNLELDNGLSVQSPNDLVFQCFYKMLTANLKKLDNRCKIIEVSTKVEYPLADIIHNVVWPTELLARYYSLEWSSKNNTPIEYDTTCAYDDETFVSNIYEATKEYYSQSGLFKRANNAQ